MIQFKIVNAADQQFSAILDQRRATIRLRWNETTGRWSFDFALDDQPMLTGRRIVAGVNLIGRLELGIGAIFGIPTVDSIVPGRDELPSGAFRLYYASQAELDSVN